MDAVPFEFAQPQAPFVLMQARVNGRDDAAVLLDTGAAPPFDVLLSESFAARAAVERSAGEDYVSSGTAGAATVSFGPALLREFRLGPLTLKNVSAGVSSGIDTVAARLGRPVDAIVGHQFVRERRIAIDYRARRVEFSAEAPPGPGLPFTLAPRRPLTLVSVTVNGRGPLVMALDTAASATLLSPAAAARVGVAAAGAATIHGAGGREGVAGTGSAALALGDVSVSATVTITPLVDRVGAAAGAPLDGVLGADLLARGRLVLDYPARRLWLDAPR